MKLKNLSFSAVILSTVLISSCIKQSNPTPAILPTGNFTGIFTRLHYSPATGKYDTLKASITLVMSSTTGYAIGGDTSHHAASHGSYVVDNSGNIAFSDATLPSTTGIISKPAKVHLNGVYQYSYTPGTGIQIQAIGDTLAYFYNLTGH